MAAHPVAPPFDACLTAIRKLGSCRVLTVLATVLVGILIAGAAQGMSCDMQVVDGACPAQGSDNGALREWWPEGNSRFPSGKLLVVNTSNFNHIVTGLAHHTLLIAFYDPRSQSFLKLKSTLEATAVTLARYGAAGNPIGWLGACDVTVDTYLGYRQAPQQVDGWQQNSNGGFRFEKPRFLPLIIMVYEGKTRLGEYTGVVSPQQIEDFLRRRSAVRGGAALPDVVAARALLEGPGPFALACGLNGSSEELRAFNATAHKLHGQLIFGYATMAICTEALVQLPSPGPQVVWSQGLAATGPVRSLTDAVALADANQLMAWLLRQRHQLLEEMTPDTSHKYLDRPEPLLILLVDPKDQTAWDRSTALLANLEDRLVGACQLVWSDCATFGSQFDATGACPVFVVVDTETMSWRKLALSTLARPQGEAGLHRTASEQLLFWLENAIGFPLNGTASSSMPVLEQVLAPIHEVPDMDSQAEGAGHGSTGSSIVTEEDFLQTMPLLEASIAANPVYAFGYYHQAIAHLLQLQLSYEDRYAHQPFDFGDLRRAQKLQRSMRVLAESPDSVQRQVEDPAKLKRLWKRIEWRADLMQNNSLRAFGELGEKKYVGLLHQGYELVRGVFRRLFRHLHDHAAAGTLGIQEAGQRVINRRAASELTVREFIDRYAKPGVPLIITGLNITEAEDWTLDFFRDRCNVSATYRQKNDQRQSWARLEVAGKLPLAEYLGTFESNATRRSWYLHDWSLPLNCPQVFGPPPYRGFIIPKYFAGDYFQRAAFQGYQHSWPSLFVGSKATESAMHIDFGGTNFWFFLLSGKKEWRFYSRRDLVNLYGSPIYDHFLFNAFSPDLKRFPLLRYAEMFVGVQNPGELIFIPAGNPHAVRNLESIHGISMNYVDISNIWIHLWHMLTGAQWRAFEMFTDGVTFPHGLRSDQQHLHFGEWKSMPWKEFSYDLQ